MFPGCFYDWEKGYIGGARGDAAIYIYLESINAARFFSWSSIGFDLPIFYPWKRGLAYSDNFLLPALIAKGLVPLVKSESVVYNLLLVTAGILNGLCTCVLAMKVTKSRPAAVFAGFVFMCCPYFVFHRGHPQLQFAFWIPLTVLGVLLFTEKRSALSAAAIGASVTGAFFCAVYYAMYSYLLAGVLLLGYVMLRWRTVRWRDLLTLLIGNLPFLLLLIPAAIPYMQVRVAMGTNPFAILKRHSPPLLSFISAPSVAPFWAPLTSRLSSMEGFLFFGFIPLALTFALIADLWLSWRSVSLSGRLTRIVRFCRVALIVIVVVGIVRGTYLEVNIGPHSVSHMAWLQSQIFWSLFLVLSVLLISLGWRSRERQLSLLETSTLFLFVGLFFTFATLGIHDTPTSGWVAPEIYRLLMHIPGFDALRGLSRLGIVVILIASVMSAIAVAQLLNRRGLAQNTKAWGVVAGILVVTAMELHTPWGNISPRIKPPKIYAAAKKLPSEEPVVALPIRSTRRDGRNFMMWNSLYMLWMKDAPNPLVNGFSGKAPFFHNVTAHVLDDFPSRTSLATMGCLVGLRYVITNSSFFGADKAANIRLEAAKHPEQIELLSCDTKDNCIFRINPIIETASMTTPMLFIPPSSGRRTLYFDIQADRPRGSVNPRVSFTFDPGTHEKSSRSVLELSSPTEWVSMELSLPVSSRKVSPTLVAVTVREAAGVRLRNLRIR
jgi:hypothetical protein